MYRLSQNNSIFLDILRVVAVQLVVIGHGISFCGIFLFLQPPNFAYIQNIAVVIFFILSGFLISYTIFTKKQDKSYTFSIFFIDRFSRIYTGLIPALLFIFVLDSIFIHFFPSAFGSYAGFGLTPFVGNLFMLQNFPINLGIIGITSFGSGAVLWTLAIEWWIYMFFGWLVLKDRIKTNIFFYLIVLSAFSIVPLYNFQYGRGNGLFLMWLFGAFIYLLLTKCYENLKYFFTPIWIVIGIAGSFCVLYLNHWEAYSLLYAFILSLLILFTMILLDQKRSFLEAYQTRIHFFASYSFSLFLIHYSIFALMANLNNNISPYILFLMSFVLSNICAIVLAYYGEMRYKSVASYLKKTFIKPADSIPE